MSAKHHTLDSLWPATLPALTGEEAIAAVKKLLRAGGVRIVRYRFRVGSGRRRNWGHTRRNADGTIARLRDGKAVVDWTVNPAHGWRALVHAVSHWVFSRKHPEFLPHDRRHATLEGRMIRVVLDRGWLTGALRPAAPAVVAEKVPVDETQPLRERLARWESKLKRAETAIRKLRLKIKYRERKAALIAV